MAEYFSNFAKTALNHAEEVSVEIGQGYIGSEHLLYGILTSEGSVGAELLRARGADANEMKSLMLREKNETGNLFASPANMSPRLKTILKSSAEIAKKQQTSEIGTEHLLYAILEEGRGAAVRLLSYSGIIPDELREDVRLYLLAMNGIFGASGERQKKHFEYLTKYGRDLTAEAMSGTLGHFIGRENECDRILQILCRKNKNNPCLVGEPGVGKTAAVEGIALMIAEGRAPKELLCKTVFALDLPLIVAGAKYRGDFEERLKNVIEEAQDPSVILFIDEIHTLIGSGSSEGAVDGANILKPALARGMIRVIGATTFGEYKKYIERDPALERRFAKVILPEPSKGEAKRILAGIKGDYEKHHGIRIGEDAVNAAVDLSAKYITDRFLPDKAIDLLDEASSMLRLHKESADEKEREAPVLTAAHIREALSLQTGRKEGTAENGFEEFSSKMEKELYFCEEKIRTAGEILYRENDGENGSSPRAVFLFTGESGSGKSAFSKAMARAVYDSDNRFFRLDMSAFADRHSISRLIGSDPGYIGYGEGGQLTEQVKKTPSSLWELEHFDAAANEVKNLFYKIFDEGKIEDSTGRTVSFKNCIFVLSVTEKSNPGAHISGFLRTEGGAFPDEALRRKPDGELLEKVNEVFYFSKPTADDIPRICQRIFGEAEESRGGGCFGEEEKERIIAALQKEKETCIGRIRRRIAKETEKKKRLSLSVSHNAVDNSQKRV